MSAWISGLPDQVVLKSESSETNYQSILAAWLTEFAPGGLTAEDVVAGRGFQLSSLQREAAREAARRRTLGNTPIAAWRNKAPIPSGSEETI